MTVKFISDSTSDLPREIIDKYDIEILPLHVILGETSYDDGVNITRSEIFQYCEENKTTPKTSAPSLTEAINAYQNVLAKDANADIIYFTICSDMSNSFNILRMAAEELEISDRVYPIDSRNLSTGIGLLIIEACKLAEEGKTAQEIYDTIQDLIPRVRMSFVVDTLEYLYRGGRCSGLTALMGTALKIHPEIVVENGVMHSAKKYMGSVVKAEMTYSKEISAKIKDAKIIALVEAGADKKMMEDIEKLLRDEHPDAEILCTNAGSVICSHCGPGVMGIGYIE